MISVSQTNIIGLSNDVYGPLSFTAPVLGVFFFEVLFFPVYSLSLSFSLFPVGAFFSFLFPLFYGSRFPGLIVLSPFLGH